MDGAGGERWGPGARLGELVLGERLGEAGLSTVWAARHAATGAPHVVKALPLDADPEVLARLRREGEAQAAVDDHPHVVRVRSAGTALGQAYLVLEHAPGGDLAALLRAQGRLEAGAAVRLVAALARGAAHCHARGVLHRDIGPSSVVFAADGRPMLVDFGLARLEGRERLTRTGALLGTPGRMAPEQLQGLPADERTDVHGLGLLLYECLTGRLPWDDAAEPHLQRGDPAPPATHVALPRELERLVLATLSRTAADRPPTAAALADALEALVAPGTARRRRPRGRGRGRLLRGVAVAGASLVAGSAALVLHAHAGAGAGAPPPPPAAPAPAPVASPAAPGPRAELLPPGLVGLGAPGRARNARDGSTLVWVPPSTFRRGWPVALREFMDCSDRDVEVGGYWISLHEVTWGQWDAFCAATGRTPTPRPKDVAGLADADRHPAVHVSWEAATAYCAWAGLRLPTEAEWERAARGVTDRRLYPWGDEPPRAGLLNYRGAGLWRTTAVGSYPASDAPTGCQDMSGNAWEWVEDTYDAFYYTTGPAKDPCRREPGLHILRGGSYKCGEDQLQAPLRWEARYEEDETSGLRPARDGPGPR